MTTANTLKIFVSLPSATYVQRRRFEGFLSYAHTRVRPRWILHFFSGLASRSLADADGIVVFLENSRERTAYLRLGKPVVFVLPHQPTIGRIRARRGTATIVVDSLSEGRAAAQYFLERGYRSFAYIGSPQAEVWSDNRAASFARALRNAGRNCLMFPHGADLGHWLLALPAQTAVFCANDRRAREVIACASDVGRDIPQDLAVLGVDNDTLLCETVVPALSSMPTAPEEDGQDAGRALDALLSGRPVPAVIRREHTQVVTRLSTSAEATEDPYLARAMKAVRANLAAKHTVRSLAKIAGCSDKTLLNRARISFGHSLTAEILRLRLTAAETMLGNTEIPVAQVAESCGFFDASHLALRFKKWRGVTPLALRKA